jgi:hypothetical protein
MGLKGLAGFEEKKLSQAERSLAQAAFDIISKFESRRISESLSPQGVYKEVGKLSKI